MFTELNKLRGKIARIAIAVSFIEGERLSLVVTPVPTEEAKKQCQALSTPFMLTGTAEELDAEFAKQFEGVAVAYGSLAEQVNSQLKAIEDAAAKAKAEADAKVNKKRGTTVPSGQLANALIGGTPVAGTSEDPDNDDDEGGTETPAPAAATAQPSQPAVVSADSLFD